MTIRKITVMAGTNFNPEALLQLQTEQSDLLRAIREFQGSVFNGDLKEPQVIVCGEKSSGKSSVLKALCGMKVPSSSDILATKVVFTEGNSSFSARIVLGPSVTEDKSQLSTEAGEIEKAHSVEEVIAKLGDSTGRYARDVLVIHISDPGVPNLTLWELPWIDTEEGQDEEKYSGVDRAFVEDLIKDERNVILAAVSTDNGDSQSKILEHAKKYDPRFERTLGIITKLDTLEADSEEEGRVVKLVKKDPRGLRWHALWNGNPEVREWDEKEELFFASGCWASVPRDFVGAGELRSRLNSILLKNVTGRLPPFIKELEKLVGIRQAKLAKLGRQRDTMALKTAYLSEVSSSFGKITMQALNGMYVDEFFGEARSAPAEPDAKYLRAVICGLNERFATTMRERGHRRCIVDDRVRLFKDVGPFTGGAGALERLTRAELIKEVEEMIPKYDGSGLEIPGSQNQFLMGELFRDQSKPWKELARSHIMSVWRAAKEFVEQLLHYLADKFAYPILMQNIFKPALDGMLDKLLEKLEELCFGYGKKNLSHLSNFAFVERFKGYFCWRTPQTGRGESQSQQAAADTVYMVEQYYSVSVNLVVKKRGQNIHSLCPWILLLTPYHRRLCQSL